MNASKNGGAASIPSARGERRAFWATEVASFRRSGLKQNEWCEQRGYSPLTFRNWLYGRSIDKVGGPALGVAGGSGGAAFVAVAMSSEHGADYRDGEVMLTLKGVQVMLRGAAASALVDRLATRLLEGC